MADIEKVINGLTKCTYDFVCEGCHYQSFPVGCRILLMKDALELLKEQKFLVDSNGKITPLPVVVRCKDCKYGKIHGINVECVAHEEVGYDPEPWHPLDWFCADWEKSD